MVCVRNQESIFVTSSVTPGVYSDLTQILSSLSDHHSNPQLKRRRKLDNISPISPSQQRNYLGVLWEQANVSENQFAAPPAMTNQANDDSCLSFMQSAVTAPVSLPAQGNFQPSLSRQDPHGVQFLDPSFQAHNFTEEPVNFSGLDFPDDLFQMWANVPVNIRCVVLFLYPDIQ